MTEVPQQREFTLETAHAVYEALSRLGFAVGGSEDLASILRRLDAGLPNEDEFIAILSWLGRCTLVHRLNQQQATASREFFKIPDLIALFRVGDDVKPFLIEVKTTRRESLKWSVTYHTKLTRYAKNVGIPLLLAWKYRPMVMWTLCDITHVKPGVHFEFTEALRQNLMGALAGDIQIVLEPGLGVHFVSEPVRFLGEGPAYADNGLLMPGNWEFRIVDAYFTNGKGERLDDVQKGLWPVLLASFDLEMESEFSDGKMRVSYVVKEGHTGMQVGHQILPGLMHQAVEDASRPDWKRIALNGEFGPSFASIRAGMEAGFENGTVRYVFDQVPMDLPVYLPPLR